MQDDSYLDSDDASNFFRAIQSLTTDQECKNFLRDLLTEKELKEFINRWKVVKMLVDKIPYDQITKETHMSSTTIARISKWIHHGKGGYLSVLTKLLIVTP